jgi:hypothetical protein
VDPDGGRFEQTVVVQHESKVTLPGSNDHWPQAVVLGGKRLVVAEKNGSPSVTLPRGTHTVSGRFDWARPPGRLSIGEQVALVRLQLGEQPLPFPDREGGTLRLPDRSGVVLASVDEAAAQRPDRLTVQAFRRVDDGVPLRVTTELALDVSGKKREVNLGPVLLADTRATAIVSELPVRLSPARELLITVQAGRHVVRVEGVAATAPAALVAPELPEPWPSQEIWVWVPNPTIRDVEVKGAPAVDPSRTELPAEWRKLTAFRLRSGQKLELVTSRRGTPEPPRNELRLRRTMWLDLDGRGWSIRDQLDGNMNRGWRLDLLAGELGRVVQAGADQLITTNPETSLRGVEIRQGNVDLTAEWRLNTEPGTIPAVGWSQDVEQAEVEINLPPGWQVMHARGADEHSTSLLSGWNLLEVLIILMLTLAAGKLTRWWWGGVMAATLVLLHEASEFDPPYLAFAFLVIALAGLRYLAPGRLRTGAQMLWIASAVVLVASSLSFTTNHFVNAAWQRSDRNGLPVPQGPWARSSRAYGAVSSEAMELSLAAQEAQEQQRHQHELEAAAKREGGSLYGAPRPAAFREAQEFGMIGLGRGDADEPRLARASLPRPQDEADAAAVDAASPAGGRPTTADPNAIPQTGPGIPTWYNRATVLSWNSQVRRSQTAHLLLLSPWMTQVLAGLRVALLGLVVFALIRYSLRWWPGTGGTPRPKRPVRRRRAAAASAAALLGLGCVLLPQSASAQPSAKLLEELQERLTRGPTLAPDPDCGDDCVVVPRLAGSVSGQKLTLVAEVHAAGPGTYQLPGPANVWVPGEVRLDGRPTREIALLNDGFLHVRMEPGRHTVELSGPIQGAELNLDPGECPKQMRIDAPGWSVVGIDDGRANGTIQLRRESDDPQSQTRLSEAPNEPTSTDLPVWLAVERTLDIGATWRVETEVELLSATRATQRVQVPLLAGEQVVTDDIAVERNHAHVELGGERRKAHWSSVLTERKTMVLSAPRGRPWTEIWTLRCSPVWQCTTTGLAPVSHRDALRHWEREYRPWPGENLTVNLLRPGAAPGDHVTIDRARLVLEPDERQTRGLLDLAVRSSTIGTQTLTLPSAVEVTSVAVNGVKRPIERTGQKLDVALQPGRHAIEVRWKSPDRLGVFMRAPEVKLGRAAVDATVEYSLLADRWLLGMGGAPGGPSSLLWFYGLLLMLSGVAVSRLRCSPLRPWQWGLLALGLTQAPPWFAAAVLCWPLAIHWRGQTELTTPWRRNFCQLAILLLTAVAVAGLIALVVAGLTRGPDAMQIDSAFSISSTHWPQDSVSLDASGHPHVRGWYVDRIGSALPRPWVISVPEVVWNCLNLGWVLWLGWSLRRWGPWAWGCVHQGGLWSQTDLPWRKRRAFTSAVASTEPAAAEGASADPASEAEPSPVADDV